MLRQRKIGVNTQRNAKAQIRRLNV